MPEAPSDAWHNLMALAQLPDGGMEACGHHGAEVLLCRIGDAVYALANECPHAGGPLSMGAFSPPLVACPWHAWEFDCRTGQCVHSAHARVPVYPVEVRDGSVWVRLPVDLAPAP